MGSNPIIRSMLLKVKNFFLRLFYPIFKFFGYYPLILTKVKIVTRERKLKDKWTLEVGSTIESFHSEEAEQELIKCISDVNSKMIPEKK